MWKDIQIVDWWFEFAVVDIITRVIISEFYGYELLCVCNLYIMIDWIKKLNNINKWYVQDSREMMFSFN